MTDEQKEQALNFGALGYSDNEVSLIWGFNPQDFGDEYAILYKKGQAMAKYAIDMKLFELAKAGDKQAMVKFENRTKNAKR